MAVGGSENRAPTDQRTYTRKEYERVSKNRTTGDWQGRADQL